MGKTIILNGSPRAPKSNSKRYADIFLEHSKGTADYMDIRKNNHGEICEMLDGYTDVLLAFPLYADGIPVTLLDFLKALESAPPDKKPVISVMINCGFIESSQNDTAIRMVELFCRQNGYTFGSVLKIGSGEAILDTPFRVFVNSKIKKLYTSISTGKYGIFDVAMPISKSLFVKASTKFWIEYGKKNGVTEKEMRAMEIEG